ncbi:MAG: disulfide bond formation protein B [Lautropia sp.]
MRLRSISHTKTAGLVFLLAWGGVAAALVSQHAFALEPCPWCIVQRLLYLVVGALALASMGVRQRAAIARTLLGLAAIASAGALVAALYQHLVAAKTASCAFTAADRFLMATGLDEALPSVFKATAGCDEANAPMLGIPYSLWSVALAVLLLGLLANAWAKAGQRR